MENSRKELFKHEGKEYEIIVALSSEGCRVKAMINGKAVNNLTYSVDFATASAYNDKFGETAVERLIGSAKQDIIDGWVFGE